MRGPLLAVLLVAAGCEKAPPAPASEPPATPAPAEKAAEPAPVPDVDRRARYEGRPTVQPPRDLPKAWRELPDKLDARLSAAAHELRTRWTPGEDGYRRVELELRLFGTDAEVEARLLSAIGALKLPGASSQLPEVPVEAPPVTWSLKVRRFVAPEGAAREAIATLRWERVPPDPADLPRCRKPRPVPAPAETPAWLVQRTKRTTSRQRVGATVAARPEGSQIAMHVLYRNGETLTGEIARLVQAAERLKLERAEADGLRQVWKGERGTFSWRPDTSDLALGCKIAGPVLALEWSPAR